MLVGLVASYYDRNSEEPSYDSSVQWNYKLRHWFSALPQKSEVILEIGSVQGAVATWSFMGVKIVRRCRRLITDAVATAPGTDPIKVRLRLLRQSHAGPTKTPILVDLSNEQVLKQIDRLFVTIDPLQGAIITEQNCKTGNHSKALSY